MTHATSTTLRTACIALLSLAFLDGCRPKGTEQPGVEQGLGKDQEALKNGRIRVREATLRLLDPTGATGRALLQIRYVPRLQPGTRIRVTPDERPIELRDDGEKGDSLARDGIFSAVVDLNLKEFQAEQQRFTRLLGEQAVIPQFEGRVRVKPLPIRRDFFFELPPIPRPRPFPIPLFPLGIPDPNLNERSLVIRDPAVVQDPSRTFNPCTNAGNPTGVWTFGHLVTEMANQTATGIAPAKFARSLLEKWQTPKVVNTFTIPARTNIAARILNPWLTLSGGTQLDLTKAPFRLLAIVNRVDLRQNLIYGGGSAGEARFVFGAVDLNASCAPLPFTVIFEYGIRKNSCSSLKAWAKQWYDLKGLAPTDPTYLSQLENITQQFVKAGANPAQTPNQNALNQLRTNERAIGIPWELREFTLASSGDSAGLLMPATVKQEPDMSFNNGSVLANWVNTNASLVVLDQHQVPELLPAPGNQHFLGARAPIPGDNLGFFWGKGSLMTTPNSRFHFSLNTCSGCHTGETQTRFTHIDPMTGPPADLSGFLTGISVPDPDPSDADNSVRPFADLDRRAADLDALVNNPCFRQFGFRPIFFMTH